MKIVLLEDVKIWDALVLEPCWDGVTIHAKRASAWDIVWSAAYMNYKKGDLLFYWTDL